MPTEGLLMNVCGRREMGHPEESPPPNLAGTSTCASYWACLFVGETGRYATSVWGFCGAPPFSCRWLVLASICWGRPPTVGHEAPTTPERACGRETRGAICFVTPMNKVHPPINEYTEIKCSTKRVVKAKPVPFPSERRSICSYLASRYNKDDSLYPQDPKVRARIDALLYFDMGTLWPRFRNTIPRFGANENKANWLLFTSFVLLNGLSPERQPDAGELGPVPRALGWLDGFLGRGRFAAGTDHVTVADHVLVANVASFEAAGRLPGTRQKV
ncbi:glutathione s-transferase [Penaeus vannamei]|uniref:Glutathione s-transferase n=1 Tax=Penaeus vannamei TaxID=6689 RepID=A0A423SIV5_PENVA|nr:glutathione s-transferase [Penaeus vannamei]